MHTLSAGSALGIQPYAANQQKLVHLARNVPWFCLGQYQEANLPENTSLHSCTQRNSSFQTCWSLTTSLPVKPLLHVDSGALWSNSWKPALAALPTTDWWISSLLFAILCSHCFFWMIHLHFPLCSQVFCFSHKQHSFNFSHHNCSFTGSLYCYAFITDKCFALVHYAMFACKNSALYSVTCMSVSTCSKSCDVFRMAMLADN